MTNSEKLKELLTHEDGKSISEFIESNYELFTVASVFGALAVYLTSFQENPTFPVRLGITSSLGIFAIVIFTSIQRTISQLFRRRQARPIHLSLIRDSGYIAFLLCFFGYSLHLLESS